MNEQTSRDSNENAPQAPGGSDKVAEQPNIRIETPEEVAREELTSRRPGATGQRMAPSQGSNFESGLKRYLIKAGKIVIVMSLLGSMLLVFAIYMVTSTLDRIITEATRKR